MTQTRVIPDVEPPISNDQRIPCRTIDGEIEGPGNDPIDSIDGGHVYGI